MGDEREKGWIPSGDGYECSAILSSSIVRQKDVDERTRLGARRVRATERKSAATLYLRM